MTTNYLTNLLSFLTENYEKWTQELTAAYVASAFCLLQNEKEGERLIKEYHLHKSPCPENVRYITLLARHFPDHLKKIEKECLHSLVQGIASNQLTLTTASNTVQGLLALAKRISFPKQKSIFIRSKNLDLRLFVPHIP